MVRADLEGLVLAHEQADLAAGLVLQQLGHTQATLLPLVVVTLETIQLRFPAGSRIRMWGRQFIWPSLVLAASQPAACLNACTSTAIIMQADTRQQPSKSLPTYSKSV